MSCPEDFVISIVVNTCKTPKEQLIYCCFVLFSTLLLIFSYSNTRFLCMENKLQCTINAFSIPCHLPMQILNKYHKIQCSSLSLQLGNHIQKQVLNQAVPSPSLTSAQVGWIPMVSSSSSLVRPHFIAAAKPWVTSPAFGPRTWSPITRSFKTGESKTEVTTKKGFTKALVPNSH